MSSKSDLDFKVFSAPLARDDFKAFYREQGTALLARYGVVLVGAFVITPSAAAVTYFLVLPRYFADYSPLISIWLLAVVVCMAVATAAWVFVFRREVRLARFCRVNNLLYRSRVQNLRAIGAPFRNNLNSITAPRVSGMFDNEKFTLGLHAIINDRDGGKAGVYTPFVFARVGLPRPVPHIILLNKKSRIIPTHLSARRNATLKLEGDFAEKFTLICPQNYERDALYIFTPDVIAAIYELAHDGEIELVDDQLFLYTRDRKIFHSPDKMMALFGVLRQLNRRFDRQTKRYRDDRAARKSENVATIAKRLKARRFAGQV
ncbi:MAG: hypothetical protein LBC95_03225 [Candidatus Nomurabacteria bacterium]|jgi:hypothetical protein|nr:hypothetical protein [Candidatus Nomurabacteria bacterium]